MAWMALAAQAAPYVLSAAGAAYGAQQSGKAADKQGNAAKQGIAEQQRQYNIGLNLLEPQRSTGYQALDDLARLYGYSMPGYQPANMLLASGGAGGTSVKGVTTSADMNKGMMADLAGGPLGGGRLLGGADNNALNYFKGPETKQYGGTINALAGTVDVSGGGSRRDDLMTEYLRTGEWSGGKGGKMKRLRSAVDALREQGYQYGEGGASMPGTIAPRPAGQPGDMSRFFTSPDYQFRRDEGQRDIGNSFAARDGAASGNALKALTEFNQGLAAGAFGDYRNALFNMAGMGQTATTQAIGSGQSTSNNLTNLYGAQGDARASGVMGAANSITGGVNSGLNAWVFNRYMNNPYMTSHGYNSAAPAYSNYGPYAGGYRFPG